MPTNVPWDDATAGLALARAMAQTYGLSQEAVLAWYHKAINALENLDRAREAVKGLIEEPFVEASYGYEERDRDAYHAHYWNRLGRSGWSDRAFLRGVWEDGIQETRTHAHSLLPGATVCRTPGAQG